MDNKFYIDDFERYLKEKADEFKMYPSKRVWNSIYNDMHPGSRWPSISMCIVLIGALFLVGFLNTNTTNKNVHNSFVNQTKVSPVPVSNTVADLDKSVSATKDITTQQATLTASAETRITAVKNNLPGNTFNKNIAPLIIASANNNNLASQKLLSKSKVLNTVAVIFPQNTTVYNAGTTDKTKDKLIGINSTDLLTTKNNQNSIIEKNRYYETIAEKEIADLKISIAAATTVKESNKTTASNALSEADKFWIENYAMYNRPAPKKWKGKLSLQAYITPSVVYRTLENTAADKNVGLAGFINNSNINNSTTHKPSFGIELGTGLQYDLSKRIKLKAGVQLNFTRYNAHAFDNGHPITTSLTMLSNDGNVAYEEYRISPYNSSYGITPVKLHNQTYQVSLPVGADMKITGLDNVEWYAGASIQPTFVLAGRSYLISSDGRNYVKESDMLNRFNLNAGFETYVAIKTKGITWQIGPQFRKQLFSTNDKIYSVEERLMNYGLKIGITKKL